MDTPLLTVDLDSTEGHLNVGLAGELDATTVPRLLEAVIGHEGDGDEVRLDLGSVTFCDSSGAAALFRLNTYVTGQGATATVCRPDPRVMRVLTICGMDDVLTISAS